MCRWSLKKRRNLKKEKKGKKKKKVKKKIMSSLPLFPRISQSSSKWQ